jgi:hypothetical protein
MWGLLSATFVILLLLVGCGDSARWEERNAGLLTLRTSTSRIAVEQECKRRGVVAPTDANVYGCMDFTAMTLVAVPEMKILAHELCHYTLWTVRHSPCPVPVM